MKYTNLLLGIITMTQIASLAHAETFKIKTPRGTEVEVVTNYPAKASERSPVIIIAPGQGYHMGLPLVQQLAETSVKNGFISYQFNWSYYSSDPTKGQPSDDFSNEIEDMQTVLRLVKSNSRVDSSKIVIAGKSIGTLVSYAIFNSDVSLAGLILMTPLCTDPDNQTAIGNESYPKFSANTRPIAIILGNSDAMCSLPMLYDFVKDSTGNVSVNIFGGGHSLTFGKGGDPSNIERDARNIGAATTTAALWAKIIVHE